jgi:hypothetical protein
VNQVGIECKYLYILCVVCVITICLTALYCTGYVFYCFGHVLLYVHCIGYVLLYVCVLLYCLVYVLLCCVVILYSVALSFLSVLGVSK